MIISDVTIFRDGGTITILIDDDPKAGEYTLPTPFEPEPRSIFWKQYRHGKRTPEGKQMIRDRIAGRGRVALKITKLVEGNYNRRRSGQTEVFR